MQSTGTSKRWQQLQQHFIALQLILNPLALQVAVLIEEGQDN